MSADKYSSIFSPQPETIVYIFSCQMEAIAYIFTNFQNCARCEKDLKGNQHKSLHLAWKYAPIFVLGHYLFLLAHSFLRASLSENCHFSEQIMYRFTFQVVSGFHQTWRNFLSAISLLIRSSCNSSPIPSLCDWNKWTEIFLLDSVTYFTGK